MPLFIMIFLIQYIFDLFMYKILIFPTDWIAYLLTYYKWNGRLFVAFSATDRKYQPTTKFTDSSNFWNLNPSINPDPNPNY